MNANLTVRVGDAFAVYGLLRAGESGFERFGLADAFAPLGPCLIPGRLYDFGIYPGLIAGDGQVLGELFDVRDASVLAKLDPFEGFWPEDLARSRYERVKLDLVTPERSAWVYRWVKPIGEARLIESGDWFKR